MKTKDVVKAVIKIAEPIVTDEGLSLWDVEYAKEGGENYLTVYVDKEGGVAIDDCERVSRAIDPLLDRADMISESYNFCVSSAGLTRRLRTPAHYAACIGKPVEVHTFSPRDNKKLFVGRLISYDNGTVTIAEEYGEDISFSEQETALCKLYFEF